MSYVKLARTTLEADILAEEERLTNGYSPRDAKWAKTKFYRWKLAVALLRYDLISDDEILALVLHQESTKQQINFTKSQFNKWGQYTRGMICAAAAIEIAVLKDADDWRPIETAPKEGDPVLLYKPDERMVGPYILVGYWGDWPGYPDECWIACDGKPQGYFSQTAQAKQGYPTHWKPLPGEPIPEMRI